ncbi:MAG: 50S ribosomal protein L29 [Candidatus Hydrogenedentes bacterium]|nr:50S ribosomal protein L29 [Candidatus Hydrogenedentota bacterium]
MKASEIRELSEAELRQRISELEMEIAHFRLQIVTGVVENVRTSRNARRDIARINTILRERELAAAKGKS